MALGRRRASGALAAAVVVLLALYLSLIVPTTASAQVQPLTVDKGAAKSFASPGSASGPGNVLGTLKKIDTAQPLYLQGDELVYDTKGNKVVARGNVEIYYNNYILTADEVVYDQGASTLTAVGNVTLKEPNGNVVKADRYTLTDDFRDGFVQSLSIVARDDTRIAAERATRREGNVTEFSNARFTPCRSHDGMPPLWCISAASVVHDQQAATITYQDAQFELFGFPILYLPYFQHADPSVKRKSGFLMPEFGNSTQLGFSTEIPYYFALAPNFDFTFHPRYFTQQGVLWQGDFRHRLSNGQYSVKFAAIDQLADNLPADTVNRSELEGWRGSVETKGQFSLASWWKFGWDITVDSDDNFRRFYKLDNVLLTDRINTVYLTGQSERNYFGANLYHFGGLLLNDTSQADSRVHPIIDYNYVFADPVLGGELSWDTNVLSFSRDDAVNATRRQDHNRISTEVKWRRRMTDAAGITYTPFANLRGDVYQMRDFIDPETGLPVDSETVARGLATAGTTVTYPWIAHSDRGSHVVEPIGQLITRQASVTQRKMPDEDARSLVFDDTNLFEVRKFSGLDRLETGTRANVGVQYTFQANSGGYARLLAGQSFHLKGDNAYRAPGVDSDGNFIFNPASGLETDKSDYVIGAYLAPSSLFRIIAQSRFDERDFALRRQDVFAMVNLGPLQAQAVYTYEGADPALGTLTAEQDILAVVGLKLTDRWSIQAGLRYDIDAKERIQDSLSLRYADECFVLTVTYAETFIEDPSRDLREDKSLYVRFELKHLGEFRYKTDLLDHVASDQQPPGAGSGQ